MLLRMQQNVTLLAKQAIREALKGNWDATIELNTLILDKNPENVDARLRLGHAYIQTKHLIKAKKIFNEVLEQDPLNPVAQKNISLINKRVDVISPVKADAGALIKEPGTTAETNLKLSGRGVTAESFAPGENLIIKPKRYSAEVFRIKNNKEVPIGSIENKEVIKCLNRAVKDGSLVGASFIKGKDRDAEILIKTTYPVFRSEKQDIRPYIKKGSLDDGEIEEEEIEVELS
jgi:tetratricopeptide (TPR) repeat protein